MSLVQFGQWSSEASLSAAFLQAEGACWGRPSGLRYLPVLGSGSDSVLALAASHSFSSFPSYAHVCAVSEKPPSSETPEDMRPIDPRECKLVNEKKNLLYLDRCITVHVLYIPKIDVHTLPAALPVGLHIAQIQTALFHFDKSL